MLEKIQLVKQKIRKAIFLIFYASSFKKFGQNSTLCYPFKIEGAKFISIESKIYINEGAWLLALQKEKTPPKINIGSGTYIGRFSHIVCVRKIEIAKNVLVSDKVYISDNLHDYKDIGTPIKSQDVLCKNPIYIGQNSWLGENVCVIGASVGKHCVIGANAVVTTDIPDYSLAVGAPAKVIKKFNQQSKEWEKIN